MDLDVLPNAQCTQFHGKWAEKDRNFGVTLMIEPVFMRATREGVKIMVVLFGLVHIIGMDFSIISSLLVLIAGTMVGIMFSMVAIESGSVWNSGIVHSLWNILIIGGGLSISEKADEYSVMTYVLDSKDFVFTGGEFGIESSIIALLGYVIVTLAAICMIKKKAKV
jgi:putative transporter